MNLKPFRIKAGLSQEVLARRMEVSRQTIMNWEDGKSLPTADKAVRLAVILGTTVEKMVGKDAE